MTSCGSSLLKTQMDGPWEIIFGLFVSYCGIAMTLQLNGTTFSPWMSRFGASEPIQVAPAVESIAKMHWPAFRKFPG